MVDASAMPEVSERVRALHAQMTLEEKLAQLVGYWLDQDGTVAPMQSEMAAGQQASEQARRGDRARSRPLHAGVRHPPGRPGRARRLAVGRAAPAQARDPPGHPRPRPRGVPHRPRRVAGRHLPDAARLGRVVRPRARARDGPRDRRLDARSSGIHQGLAPVLDVVRDPRWGRVDECIGEDPYLVGTIGTAYVRGPAGARACTRRSSTSSATRARGPAATTPPCSAGPREIADVFLPPFEMAILDGGARSVMNSYADIDGVPVAASAEYLTDAPARAVGLRRRRRRRLLRGRVPAGHARGRRRPRRGRRARARGRHRRRAAHRRRLPAAAGRRASAPGELDEGFVDRAVLRALAQKEELGLLDPDAFEDEPPTDDRPRLAAAPDARPPPRRGVGRAAVERRRAAAEPVARRRRRASPSSARTRTAPRRSWAATRSPTTCWRTTPSSRSASRSRPSSRRSARAFDRRRRGAPELVFAEGCDGRGRRHLRVRRGRRGRRGRRRRGRRRRRPGRAVRPRHRGRGQRLGVARPARRAARARRGAWSPPARRSSWCCSPAAPTRSTGRSTAPGARPGAVLQAFFPGEGAGRPSPASSPGAVNPSGRLPVSLPRSAGAQPYSYLHPILGGPSDVTSTDSTPLRPFGFGLSYTTFAYSDLVVDASVAVGRHVHARR